MCGIAGYIDFKAQTSSEELRGTAVSMGEALSHRGPDHGGVWFDAHTGIALAHRRLSILDLSPLGNQPMRSRCGRYVLVFNGEIYNFRVLRAELQGFGASFAGTSDTEIMLEAISRWGVDRAVMRFNGMFAFALWDTADRSLTLGRDRFGEKPLYYGSVGDMFLFASELKALRCHPAFDRPLDRAAVAAYLRLGYIPGPMSIYSGIAKLPAGSLLTVTPARRGAATQPRQYWSVSGTYERGMSNPFPGSEHEVIEELDRLLSDSVKLRMEADVPLGAFLSGGIDSSTVVALMQAHSCRPVKTFTIGFGDLSGEAGYARAVARHLRTEHTEMVVSSQDALDVIPRLPSIYDEPFADTSQIPTYCVSELARRQVTVSLSGDGGDEIFGGYSRYVWAYAADRWLNRIPRPIRSVAGAFLVRTPAGVGQAFTRLASHCFPASVKPHNPLAATRRLGALLQSDDATAVWLALSSMGVESIAVHPFPTTAFASALPDRGLVQNLMFMDAMRYLPDDILVKLDRATMAVSLESRVPLLDHRILEFAATLRITPSLSSAGNKRLLRRVLYRYVPPSLVDRPKMGFGAPIRPWLRGPLHDWAESLLDPGSLTSHGFLNPKAVRTMWSRYTTGKQNCEEQIWSVLMLQAWLQYQRPTQSQAVPLAVGI